MAENMYLTEILAPQFVVPVAAVVLCAFVVFVFGFKHVAEPNFDFESNDEKKKRHNKSKKVKQSQSNGHLSAFEHSKVTPVAPTPNAVPEKPKDVPPKLREQKVKKPSTGVANKVSSKPAGGRIALEEQEQVEGVGEWTTCISKKGKKKKTESAKLEDLAVSAPLLAEAATTTETTATNEALPQQQREVKPKRNRGAKAEQVPAEKSAIEEQEMNMEQTPLEESKTEENETVSKAEVKIPGLEFKTEETNTSKKKKKKKTSNKDSSPAPTDITLDEHSAVPTSSDVAAAPAKPHTLARDTSAAKASIPTTDTRANTKESEDEERLKNISQQQDAEKKAEKKTKSTALTETSIEVQIADAMRESPQPSPTETKPTKSPKKNSKKKTKSSNSNKETISQTESSHKKSENSPPVQEVPGASQVQMSSSLPETVTEREVHEPKQDKAVGDATQSAKPASDSQPKEDAEWQEAKPGKKRKKARRDN